MNTLRSFLVFAALVSAAVFAPAQTVTVVSPFEVRIDGQHAGQLVDVMVNHPQLASAVQNAANARFAEFTAQKDAEREAAVAAANASAASVAQAKDAEIAALRTLFERAGFDVAALLAAGPDSLKTYLDGLRTKAPTP